MVDWYPGYDPEKDDLTRILKERYEVEYTDNPDYLICGVYGEVLGKHALKYDAIRIFFTGEAVSSNFNYYDYAVGFDDITWGDRYFRMPLCCLTCDSRRKELIKEKENFNEEELKQKDLFANFIYSNKFGSKYREEFFRLLSSYKNVASAGGFLNNMDGYRCEDKIDFMRRCKFSIAFENGMYKGYTTEKIVDAFAAHTIPIYWGNPDIGKDFDERSFINCHNYNSFDEVIEIVKELDSNDDLYIEMMQRNPFVYSFDERQKEYENFLYNIFDQDVNDAYRRNQSLFGSRLENVERKKIQCYPVSHIYSNRITDRLHFLYERVRTKQ
jgi:hypothetical protein